VRVATGTAIACPPEQVFDLVADLRNETQWSSRVSSAELRTGEPIERGSRSIVTGGTPYEVTITTPKQYASLKTLCEAERPKP